jgi:ceramide glucosyltransferase
LPLVTVFKPLAGEDEDLRENLESFARLDYPSFEILFGVASKADPAFAVAERFLAVHPELVGRVVVTDPGGAINPKVAQLLSLEREAAGEVFVISDSNVRVRPTYLRALVDELQDERVGLVCTVFSGAGEQTVGAALENLQVCASCIPGLLATDAVSKRPLTVGKSMAMRRGDLERVGGYRGVADVLAEDYVLGRRFLDAGFAARTSLEVVENRNVECSIRKMVERHTRWSKMRRALLPLGFLGEPILTPLNGATVGLLLAPSTTTGMAWCVACALQTFGAMLAVRILRGSWMSWRYIPLELFRSYIALFCWMRAWASRRIEWRGHLFLLGPSTTIEPLVREGVREEMDEAHAESPSRARLAA